MGIRDAETGKQDRGGGLSLVEITGSRAGGEAHVVLNQETSLIRAGSVSAQEEQVYFLRKAKLLR